MLTVDRGTADGHRGHAPRLFDADWNSPAAAADFAACRELLRTGSRSFMAASLLLPRSVRLPACALYAFCRLADDAVDLADGGADPIAALRERLTRIYRGQPAPIAADRALARVVQRFGIPRAVPDALIEGFEWDVQARRYESLDDLHAYAARVAATVGVMMALLMGVRSSAALARACDLGVAMQLSNIARDVGEDARMGRIYLPLRWLREAGIDADAWLQRPVFDPALASVVQRLLAAADRLYGRVDTGVAQLPIACRPGINAARFLYAEIGREVERRGLDSVSQRAVVGAPRKLWLLLQAASSLPFGVQRDPQPPLDAARFLVDAASEGAIVAVPSGPVGRFIDLIERLEERKHMRRIGSTS